MPQAPRPRFNMISSYLYFFDVEKQYEVFQKCWHSIASAYARLAHKSHISEIDVVVNEGIDFTFRVDKIPFQYYRGLQLIAEGNIS